MVGKKGRIVAAWVAVLLWMVLIFVFSRQQAGESNTLSFSIVEMISRTSAPASLQGLRPSDPFLLLNTIVRKSAHFFLYLVLGILLINALIRSGVQKGKNFGIAIFAAIIFAAGDEIHQMFIPGRTSRVLDVLIDTAGAMFGIVIYLFVREKLRRRTLN